MLYDLKIKCRRARWRKGEQGQKSYCNPKYAYHLLIAVVSRLDYVLVMFHYSAM